MRRVLRRNMNGILKFGLFFGSKSFVKKVQKDWFTYVTESKVESEAVTYLKQYLVLNWEHRHSQTRCSRRSRFKASNYRRAKYRKKLFQHALNSEGIGKNE